MGSFGEEVVEVSTVVVSSSSISAVINMLALAHLLSAIGVAGGT
jgi:hypothetical protein